MEAPLTYKSYLLRLWKTTHNGEAVWQASLQNTFTGQRQGFPDLESLFAHLAATAEGGKTAPDHKNQIGHDPATTIS